MKKIIILFLALCLVGYFYAYRSENTFGVVQAIGVTNPNVTQANIHQTICVSGWTGTVRPSVSYTNALKIKQLRGNKDQDPTHYEEDHFIPLVLGGNPTDPNNLWPQLYPEAKYKDQVEVYLSKLVCTGQITLQEGQSRVKQWLTIFKQISNKLGGIETDEDDQ